MEATISSLFLLVLLPFTSYATCSTDSHQIHLLRPHSGAAGHPISGVNCLSWRFAVESNNIRGWTLVPEACEEYVGHYMLGQQYAKDCSIVADAAIEYAKTLEVGGDGKDVWVFDIDETSLSNLPYYARSDVAFGAIKYNNTKFSEWVAEGKAPAVPAVLKLYKILLSMGYKIVFITGTTSNLEKQRTSNLKRTGYHTWEKLIFKEESDKGGAVVYKSSKRKQLEEAGGYRIIGNIGDQWSDLIGTNVGNRTFKLPDPMYYIN